MKKLVKLTLIILLTLVIAGSLYAYSPIPYFPDVPITHWAFEYVQQLYEAGITTGFPDGTYKPEDPVKRSQMAAFLIRTLEHVNTLEARVADLETLLAHFTRSGDDIYIDGANLHVLSGSGTTGGTVNGLGNIIIGYNEARTIGVYTCSLGQYTNQTECESNGGVWAIIHKSGSHNLVVGKAHNYSRFGGIVVGDFNTISGVYSSVSGGYRNTASDYASSVSGGYENTASFLYSSVSGGYRNTASGAYSSVSGGSKNTASYTASSVSGGYRNTASDYASSVSGGFDNTASDYASSVSGGYENTASGEYSSVSGGYTRSVSGSFDWRAGTLFETN